MTGATGGIGTAITLGLLRRGIDVVTIARDPDRAAALMARVPDGPDSRARLTVLTGDLSTREGIADAARSIARHHSEIHLLINNAGAHFPDYGRTADGVERHIAVDFLAAYGLTTLLESQLRAGRARVVNVVSDTVRDTRRIKIPGRPPRPVVLDQDDIDDLARLNRAADFDAFQAYGRAKLLTVIAGVALSSRLAGDVTINSVHPGIVATDIIDDVVPAALRPLRSVIRSVLLTPAEGAQSPLMLATDPAFENVTGRYFVRTTEAPLPAIALNPEAQRRLLRTSENFFDPVRPALSQTAVNRTLPDPRKASSSMKISSMRFITDDLERMVAFYETLTALTFQRPAPTFAELPTPHGATLAISERSTLTAFPGVDLAAASDDSAILELQVDDVDAVRARIDGEVVLVDVTLMPWGNRTMILRDPDGNRVGVFTPYTEGRSSGSPAAEAAEVRERQREGLHSPASDASKDA